MHTNLGAAQSEFPLAITVNDTVIHSYIVTSFSTRFAEGEAVETFTWTREGQRLILHGYYIQQRPPVGPATASASTDAPPGWHKLRDAELEGRSDKEVTVHGDFDGDGKEDTAALFTEEGKGTTAIYVRLSSAPDWIGLGVVPRSGGAATTRLSVTPPGVYRGGNNTTVSVQLPAISVVRPPGVVVMWCWNSNKKQFERFLAMK